MLLKVFACFKTHYCRFHAISLIDICQQTAEKHIMHQQTQGGRLLATVNMDVTNNAGFKVKSSLLKI